MALGQSHAYVAAVPRHRFVIGLQVDQRRGAPGTIRTWGGSHLCSRLEEQFEVVACPRTIYRHRCGRCPRPLRGRAG